MKAVAVRERTFIGDGPEENFFIQLYNLSAFYAEVSHNHESN